MGQGTLTLIVGGARSGKSRHAEKLVEALPAPWTYIATAEAYDAEMSQRIALHRERRNSNWQTIEAPSGLDIILERSPIGQPVLVDCLTLWLTNVMLSGQDTDSAASRLAQVLSAPRGPWFVVSNEVGWGIVPDNALARQFRDAQGRLNQMIAQKADTVFAMFAGLPLRLK